MQDVRATSRPQATTQDVLSLAASLVAALTAVAYIAARVGFVSDRRGPLVAAGIAWFVVCLPAAVNALAEKAGPAGGQKRRGQVTAGRAVSRWWSSPPAVLLWALVAITALGLLAPGVATIVGLALAAAGGVMFALVIARVARGRTWPAALALVVFALLVVGMLGYEWWGPYQTPLFLERFVTNSFGPPDTLFHAAVANMFSTYGVPSTGVDGIPIINYHFGSHVLLSSIARLVGAPVLRIYQYGFQAVVVPVVMMALVLAAGAIRGALGRTLSGRELLRSWWPWFLVGVALVGLLPPPFKQHLWQGAWLITSESYAVALLLGLIWTALLLRAPEELERPGVGGWILALAVLPLLLAATGMAKVSVMVLMLPAAYYVALRTGWLRRVKVLAGLAVATVLALVTMTVVQSEGHFEIALLDFPKGAANNFGWGVSTAAALKFLPFLLLGHWMVTLAYLAFRFRDTHFRPSRAGSRLGLLDVEVLVLVTVLGFLPGLVLKIPGGSAGYFSDVQRYLAAALLLGRYATLPIGATAAAIAGDSAAGNTGAAVGAAVSSDAVPSVSPSRAGTVARAAVTAVLIGVFAWAALAGARLAVRDNRNVRTAWGVAGGTSSTGKPTADFHPEQWEVVNRLEALGEQPLAWKRATALYIPRTHTYWSIPEGRGGVFLAPAVTGIAAIGGLPESARTTYTYGYDSYTPWSGSFGSKDEESFSDIRARAKELGFERLMVFRPQGWEEISLR